MRPFISFQKLRQLKAIETVIIHSLEPTLYQASLIQGGQERLIIGPDQQPIRSFNLMEIQALFEDLPIQSLRLRHESAYDEMIGQPLKVESNQLEVELAVPQKTNRLAHRGLAHRLGLH